MIPPPICQERALRVIQNLNRFAKPTNTVTGLSGRSVPDVASIPEALKNVLDLVSHEFELDRITIKNEIPNNLPPVSIDPHQLEEVLFNLIVNAAQAMREKDGELVIAGKVIGGGRASVIPAIFKRESRNSGSPIKTFGDDSKNITLTIQDTGSGIPQNQMKHLFEPFRTTKGDKGTGLGLYITKQIIERSGGRISVNSQEEKGTVFTLEFKVQRNAG